MLIAMSFLMILMLEAARRQRKDALLMEFRFRLFALRDQLREVAMNDPAQGRNWLFQYLDSTIANSIKRLPKLSIWFMIGLLIAHKDDETVKRAKRHLEQAYSKPQNIKHKEIEEKFIEILGDFIMHRHILMLFISVVAVVLPVAVASALRRVKRRSLELIVESPETSTLYDFPPYRDFAKQNA